MGKTILGIETSCDETAVAIIEVSGNIITVRANLVYSQIKEHRPFGGVVPEVAARKHLEILPELLLKARSIWKKDLKTLDGIAVTLGPGLVTSLMVGFDSAKTVAWLYKKKLISVNHLEGHIHSGTLPDVEKGDIKKIRFPALALVVSGGHTELIMMKNLTSYTKAGETVDDAAGEAFDKVAKLLGLGYPGGPAVEKAARGIKNSSYKFPRPMSKDTKTLNFSFAGLKTAVRILLEKEKNWKSKKKEISRAFEEAVVDSIIIKTNLAIERYKPKTLLAGGGVINNELLRARLKELAIKKNISLLISPKRYTMDNAVMVAYVGYLNRTRGVTLKRFGELSAKPNLEYGEI